MRRLGHRFDNTVATPRQVRIYGDFTLQSLDLSGCGARRIRLSEPLHCERFSLCGGSCPLDFAPLLDGIFRINLSRLSCGSLLPLAECRQLMTLDLTDADVSRAAVDEYLLRLVTHHYGRRNCDLTLPVVPSGTYTNGSGCRRLTMSPPPVWKPSGCSLTRRAGTKAARGWSVPPKHVTVITPDKSRTHEQNPERNIRRSCP